MENKLKPIRFRSISRSADFQKLRESGERFHVTSWLLVNMQTTENAEFRIGWTIPRQIGTAVVRNRLRRWGREYLRSWSSKANRSLDMNLVFKRRDKDFYRGLKHKDFDGALEKLVAKLERLLR